MKRHPALGHPTLSHTATSLLKRLVCALTLLSASAQAAVVTATWNAASDTPVTASSYTATGNTVTFALNFAPQTRMDLMVVKNTGLPFVQGTFSNLTQGQAVALSFGGTTYNYVANYYGGSGNDLVLQSADVVLAAWGNNTNGRLGNGNTTFSSVPLAISSMGVLAGKTVLSVAAGSVHSLALCSDGMVAAWGSNSSYGGTLGNGNTADSSVPVAVTSTGVLAGKTVISVATGGVYSLALCSDGTLAAWGSNSYGGSLGNGTPGTGSSVPVAVTSTGVLAGKTAVAVAAGATHSLALCSDGTMAAWGSNREGQLGNGSTIDGSVPVAVTRTGVLAGKTVIAVAAGEAHSLALCSDGTVAAWGYNGTGGLGNGTTSSSSVPVPVTSTGVLAGKTVIAVAAGNYHSLALCSDGTVAAWGNNRSGGLGNGNTTFSLMPVAVTSTGALAGKTVISVDAGGYHSLALCSDGTVAAWGENLNGQLGNGTTSSSSVPVAVSANSSFLATRAIGGGEHNISLGNFVPVVATLAATQVSATSSTLNGTVNANGYSSVVSFDYGLTTSYGSTVVGTPTPVTGSTPTTVSAVPPGLTPGTTYHFRVKAVSSGGTSVGSDLTFTTPSNNANLAGLALSTGTLAPTFASGTLSYAASVPNATTNLTVTPTKADAGATVKVNGTSVASGSASGSISLAVGNNTLNTVVTAADGTTTKTYTISVTRLPLPPTVSSPTSTAVTTNSATLGGNVTGDGGAAVTARGVVLALTAANANPQLGGPGVTNVSGSGTTGVFTVGAGPLTPSSSYSYAAYATNSAGTSYSSAGTFTTASITDANLAGLALSAGTLTPAFASGTTSYTANVPNTITSLTVTPTVSVFGATVKVNGTSVASGSASAAISLAVGANTISTVVTAADGTTTKTYTLTVTRRAVVAVLATYSAATDVPLTVNGYEATGNTVSFALNFAPQTLMDLMVVKNTGLPFIQGTFSNLTQGQAVALSYGGSTYNYVANYYGGSGNDLVLQSADVVLAAWGDNDHGQSGNGGTTDSSVPVAVTSTGVLAGKTVISVAGGWTHNLALCSDGTVAAWGANSSGQLGNGNTTSSSVPVAVTRTGVLAGKTVISVAAGGSHSLALCSDGTVAAWGHGFYGQLGNGDTGNSSVPVAVRSTGVLAGKTVICVAGGLNQSLALCSDGTVAAWGYNGSGQLGNGNTTNSSVPVAVTGTGVLAGKTVISVAGGDVHSLALCSDGTVAAWGSNAYGQLGNGNTTNSSVPVAVTRTGALAGKTVVSVVDGNYHSLALCSDGTVAAWGSNRTGELGNGNTTNSSVPVAVTSTGVLAGKTVISVDAGYDHSLALCSDGTVAAWGSNFYGQLGNGNTTSSSVPVITSPLMGARLGIADGQKHSLVIGAIPPGVLSMDASLISTTSATLNGSVSANGSSSAVSFEYGLTPSYGSTVAGLPGTISGISPQSVSASIAGLIPGTTYYYRAKATNLLGTSYGDQQSFYTLSSNANLVDLTLGTGTLSPSFASGTHLYTATVAGTTMTFTATVAQEHATMTINGEELYTESPFDVSLNPGVNTFTIVVTSSNGSTQTYTLTVYSSNLAAPTFIGLSSKWLYDNTQPGTEIGNLSAIDPDVGDEFYYELADGVGSDDNAHFQLSQGRLITTSGFDYDTKPTASIRVRATDLFGHFTEQTFVLLLVDASPWASFELKGHGTAAPSYVNVIFQLRDINGREINLPREIFDQNNDIFSVKENGLALSPSESFLQVAKKEDVPAKVRTILLLDNSFSVGANLGTIKSAAKGLVDSMFDQQEVAVYSFSGTYTLVKDFTAKSAANQQALKTAIDSIGLGSPSTNLYGSVLAMLNLPQWKESFTINGMETGFLVVLTDGSDTSGVSTLAEVIAKRDLAKKKIFTVGLGAEIDETALGDLQNAGYYPATNVGELAPVFAQIQSSIENSANSFYWLNYASPKRGNFTRTLTVSLKNNGNDGTNSTLTDTFNSSGFTDVTGDVIINRSVTANSGVSSLSIKNGESSIARAFTMLPPFGTPAYTWTVGNTAAATLTPIGSDGSRVIIKPTTSNIATTLTLTDTVNGYAKTIPLLIGTGVQLTPQSITFAKPADRSVTSAAFTLSPVPTASPSGLPVSLAILSGPATIVGNTVTLTGTVGTVVIRATQAGNATYAAATPVDVSFAVTSAAVVPIVSNLTAVQRAGTKLVDIRYDLAAPGLSTVALQASSDGGATWSVRVASVSGAIGSSVAPGTGKTLVWNAGTDWPQSYSTQMRFRVTTNDGVLASLTSSAETGNVTVDTRVVPTIPSPTVAGLAQQAYVKASNTGVDDLFGQAVAISGNTLVVGAPFESSAATGLNGDQANDTARRAGAVYVYIRTGSTWTQQAYLKASNTNAGDEFGSAVAIDGDTIVVGARGEASNSAGVNGNQADNSLDSAGAAYIFTRTGTTWTQQAYLKAGNGPSASDRFGGAVAVSGNTVVIGGGDGSGTGVESSGAAYVFNRTGSTWSQQAYLKASNMGFGDRFGQSVGISGDTLIVGAPGEDGAGQGIDPASNEGMTDSGAAYIFTRSGTTWNEQSYIKAFNTGSGHLFGESVAISGDTAVVGAPIENGANIGIDSLPVVRSLGFGAAYVFERSDAAWTQTSYLKRCNPRGNYYAPVFGCDVAISGSTIVVGERQECGSGTGINPPFDEASMFTGAAYVFVRNGNVWDKQAYLKASNTSSGDFFGSAVAVSDGSVVVGAANEDGGGSGVNPVSDELGLDAGAAYVYTGAGVVNSQAPVINKPVIPEATRNVYISIPVQITGGGVLTCRVVSGTLPPGVTLNATTGAVSGTPTVAGNYAFTVRATNAYGSADVPLVINVAAGAADLAPPSMRPGTVLDYEGTLDDSLDGTESDSGELIFLTTTKFEGGSYAYTKTGPNTATVTYTLSYAEPGSSETNNGTMLATFDSPTSGSYTVTGRSNGKKGSTPFNSTFSGSGTFSFTAVPDIAVAFNGQSLASGGQVDFGKIGVGSGLAERSFTISNTSSADLTGLDITIDGPNASSFSVTTPPVSPVAQGGSTTFTVQSTVGSAGLQTATLNIASNDEADASYTIKLKATGLASAPALATTVAAAGITFEGATLKATVNANNSEQAIAFDYGLTTSYGSTIEAFPATATGSNLIAVQYPVNGLLPHTKYFFRVKATGNAGTVYGSALSFTTLNRAPSIVGDDAAALPGEVLTLDALSNDVDEDGDALSMISVGSVSANAGSAKLIAGKIVFTAAATFAGTPLAYTIADSLGARTTRQITIALAPCDLSPAAVSLPPAADSYTVGVATDNAWRVTENLPWASVSPTSGTGPGNVTVTLQENSAKASRSGVMMIGGHAHTITQSGSGGLTIEVPAIIPEGMVSADYTLTIPALLPPVKFTATGLPTGLGINATSGEITGKPSAAGRFSASITGTTSAGASTKIVVPLVIQALPTGTIGSFTGLISQDDLSAGLGGSMTLNVTSTGSYTGSLNLGLATHKFTGRVVAAVGENPTISLAIPRPSPAPSLTLALTFDGSNNALTGEVGDGTQPPATVDGRRSIWAGTSASDYAALYNTVAELPASDPDQPEGAAWEQMTVTAAGATTGTGRTADGIAYTFSGPLWPDGSQPHFVLIYNKHGSVIGLPTISLGTDLADNRVTGWIDQIKTGPTATTDRTYSAGLAYTRRNLDGSPWIKPTTTLPIVLDLADEAGNASIAFSGGGVEAENQFDSLAQTFRVNKNNSTTFPAATVLAGNPCKVSMAITPATGFFSGSFTLSDIVAGRTITRAISYAGILQSHTSQGHGYFLLPGLSPSATTSPIIGGRVLVTK